MSTPSKRKSFKGLYLDCAEVHVFIVEVSAFCQLRKVAFGEGKPEMYDTNTVWVAHRPVLIRFLCSAKHRKRRDRLMKGKEDGEEMGEMMSQMDRGKERGG